MQGLARCAVYMKRGLLQAEVSVADLVGGPFECCAVYVHLDGATPWWPVCTSYPRSPGWDPSCLQQLPHRLWKDFLLCGDVNVHHAAWGGRKTDLRGREVRNILLQLGLVILFECWGHHLPLSRSQCHQHSRRLQPGHGGLLVHLIVVFGHLGFGPPARRADPFPRQGTPGPRVSCGRLADIPAAVLAGHG